MASALRLRLLPSRAACVRVARRGHGAHGHSHGHSHDSRAGGELRSTLPPLSGAASIAGARGPLPIGLELARALGNVGRALESHAQALVSPYADTFESVWYGQGLLWRRVPSGEWEATLAEEELTALRTRQAMPSTRPAMLSLYFGDDRTALVKTLGSDGRERFLSMLRLDGLDYRAHDGWTVLRELISSSPYCGGSTDSSAGSLAEIRLLLEEYLRIEHGGGAHDAEAAAALFSERASLLAVGSSPAGEPPSAWSAPAGVLLEVPLHEYLASIARQTPHEPASGAHDAIIAIDLLPCQSAAAAMLRIGNGARDRLFVDHLLLARDEVTSGCATLGTWRILSKTFAPGPWPS